MTAEVSHCHISLLPSINICSLNACLPADGNNVVDSGTPSSMFPGKDRVRFVSRVRAAC